MSVEEAPTEEELGGRLCVSANESTSKERRLLGTDAKDVADSAIPFRFLDLAPELRNKIYEELFFRGCVLLPSACKHPSQPTATTPAITRVCRQLRQEALPMFYRVTTSEAHIHRCDFGYFIDYMGTISTDYRKYLYDVEFKLLDRLTCGNGLLDLARWLATAKGFTIMELTVDVEDWLAEWRESGLWSDARVEEYLDDGEEEMYMQQTNDAVCRVLDFAEGWHKKKHLETTERQLRKGFYGCLREADFKCECTQTVGAEISAFWGYCSRIGRVVEEGDVLGWGCSGELR